MSVWSRMAHALLTLVVLCGVVGAAYALFVEVDKPIRVVRIDGPMEPAQRAVVERVVSENLGNGILSTRLPVLVEALTALQWTRSIAVRRVWPDGIHVSVGRATSIARWNSDALIGEDGMPYQDADNSARAALPELFGPEESASVVLQHYELMREIVDQAGLAVTRLGQNDRHEWSMVLDGRITVLLGREEIYERARRVLALYTRHLEAKRDQVTRVDARYANGVAVAWKQMKPTLAGR